MNGWIDRRNVIKALLMGGAGTIGASLVEVEPVLAAEVKPAGSSQAAPLDPDAALERLMQGNQRFVKHQPLYPDQTATRITELAQAQHPFVTILSCADSRVPAELIFDQGFGDIFDVRLAGNIVTPESLGSIEYAAVLLEAPLLMVLGHERCGAVTAAVKAESLPGQISAFVKPIQPALARAQDKAGDPVENAVVANVQYQKEQLIQQSSLLADRVAAGKLKIVGGRYDLDSGAVTIVA